MRWDQRQDLTLICFLLSLLIGVVLLVAFHDTWLSIVGALLIVFGPPVVVSAVQRWG